MRQALSVMMANFSIDNFLRLIFIIFATFCAFHVDSILFIQDSVL